MIRIQLKMHVTLYKGGFLEVKFKEIIKKYLFNINLNKLTFGQRSDTKTFYFLFNTVQRKRNYEFYILNVLKKVYHVRLKLFTLYSP